MDERLRAAYTAADAERRELERALHDGVQQELVALAVKLQLARRAADPRPLLDELSREVRGAIDGVRALAERVYPALLDDGGLAAALGVPDLGRYPRELETTVYFACRCGREPRLWEEDGQLRVELDAVERLDEARARLESVGAVCAVDRLRLSASIPIYDPVSAR